MVVGRCVDVRPDQSADRSPKEEGGARRLCLQETAKGGVALLTTPYEWSSQKGRRLPYGCGEPTDGRVARHCL